MAYRDDESDDDEPELAAREEPDESDRDNGDDSATVPCPYCRKEVYEAAEVCPHCRNYLSSEDAPPNHRRWLVTGVVLCLLVVLIWVASHV